jgi:hypothetical protein
MPMLPLVLSSDSHVFEPPDLWQTRIDAKDTFRFVRNRWAMSGLDEQYRKAITRNEDGWQRVFRERLCRLPAFGRWPIMQSLSLRPR